MSRRTTKRDEILAEARKRLDVALNAAKDADTQAEKATAAAGLKWSIAGALETEYKALEKALAPASRQQPAATKAAGGKRRASKGRQGLPLACAYGNPVANGLVCDLRADNAIHNPDAGYIGYHPFVSPVQPARNQSPPNGAGGLSTANTEDATANVSIAAETGA